MRRMLLLIGLVALFCSRPAMGLDPRDVRQTAGIYITVEGRMHTLFGDFQPAKYVKGQALKVAFALNTDLDVWIDGQQVPAGKHAWLFAVDAEGAWSFGERNPEGDAPIRFRVPQFATSFASDYLTVSFHLDVDEQAVVVRFSLGNHVGELQMRLEQTVARTARAITDLSLPRARDALKRLRQITGKLLSEQEKRPAWSGLLIDLGTAMVDIDDETYLTEMLLSETDEDVILTVQGRTGGGQAAADTIARALRRGHCSKIFSLISRPVARRVSDGSAWEFELVATTPLIRWNEAQEIEAIFEGPDAESAALEILLLEARLRDLTAASPLGIADCQPRLLEAKREAGVMLSNVSAGDRVEEGGLSVFPVSVRVTGSGPDVLTFIRSLEDCRAPLSIIPSRIASGPASCDVDLTLIFYDYIPLVRREPGLASSVQPVKQMQGFERKKELFLRGLGVTEPAEFIRPAWTRDPFASSAP
jgi:hypothetical protein